MPFPYVIYRGDILRVDREDGIRGELFENENLRLDLSLAGSVPVPDTDKGARSGMPGLDPLIEVGMELNATLWRSSKRDHSFSFIVPLRMVYSVGSPLLEFQGLTLSPYFNYRIRQQDETMLARYGISIGPIFASNLYNEYFYEVAPEFATPERPAYDAHGGYSGSRITLSATWHFKEFMIGIFARQDTLGYRLSKYARRGDPCVGAIADVAPITAAVVASPVIHAIATTAGSCAPAESSAVTRSAVQDAEKNRKRLRTMTVSLATKAVAKLEPLITAMSVATADPKVSVCPMHLLSPVANCLDRAQTMKRDATSALSDPTVLHMNFETAELALLAADSTSHVRNLSGIIAALNKCA